MSICKLVPSQSLPEEMTASSAPSSVAECDQFEYNVSHNPNSSLHDFYLLGLCDYYRGNFDRAFSRFNNLWSQNSSLSSDLKLRVTTALGKTAIKMDQSPDEIRTYFGHALNVDQNDADALCHYSLYGVKAGHPTSENDGHIRQAWSQPKLMLSTKLCIAEYARLSPTMLSADEIADASCRLLLDARSTAVDAWNCLRQNAERWDPDQEKELLNQILWQEESYYSQILAKNPKDVDAWHALKYVYELSGEVDKLMVVLHSISELSSEPLDRLAALVEEAQYAFHYGQFDVAERVWHQVKELNDNEYIYGVAMLNLVRDHKVEDATKLLRVVNAFDPNNTKFQQGLRIALVASMAVTLGKHDYVRLKGTETVGIFRNLRALSLELLEKFPGDRFALYVFREVNWRVAEYDEDKLAMLDPRIFEGIREDAAKDELTDLDLVSIGLAYTHLGKISKSIDERASAFQSAKSYFDQVYARRDEFLANGAVLQRHNQVENWLSKGWMAFAQREYSEAARIFSAVTQEVWEGVPVLPKQRVEAYRGLANTQNELVGSPFSAQNYTEAIRILNEVTANYEAGEKIENRAEGLPLRYPFVVNTAVIWGGAEFASEEAMNLLVNAKLQYLHFLDPKLRDESLYNKGTALSWLGAATKRSKGDFVPIYIKAVQIFEGLLKKYPTNPEIARFLGTTKLAMDQYDVIRWQDDKDSGKFYVDQALARNTSYVTSAVLSLVYAYQRSFDRILASGKPDHEKNAVLVTAVDYLRTVVRSIEASESVLQTEYIKEALKRFQELPTVYCKWLGGASAGFATIKSDIETSRRLSKPVQQQLLGTLKSCFDHAFTTNPKE